MLHLHIETTNTDVVKRLSDSTYGTGATNGLVLWKDTNHDGRFWNYQNKSLIFGTSNVERMRIREKGNVGIGVVSPTYRLHIASGTTTSPKVLLIVILMQEQH